MDENQLWEIRAYVYRHLAETTRPPTAEQTASRFALTHEQAVSAYEQLHQRHAFFLRPGTHDILMANPFSGVETPFRVRAHGRTYFANCAWDSLGIPAALHAEAEVEAVCAHSSERVQLSVTSRRVESSEALVHFLVPFRDWYADLLFT